jgi:YVTN family beta-propeller protein
MGSEEDTTVGAGTSDGQLAVGSVLAGHRIEAELGRGGMGVVYRARHIALGRDRALKVIAPGLAADPSFRERFRRESRVAASIEHPNLIPVYDAGEDDGHLYIAMRLVDGQSLRDLVSENGPLDPREATRIVEQVASALDASHAAGLVHRDVKPGNVLLEGETAYLTDFGISRAEGTERTLTSAGQILGSPDYVAPEQAEGKTPGPAADLYSLGAVLHFALTGWPPFDREGDLAKLYAHAHAPRPHPTDAAPWLPTSADSVVGRAMAIEPARRYASGARLAAAATAALRDAPPPPESARSGAAAAETASTRRLRRSRTLAGLAIAAGLLAAALAVILIAGGGDDAVQGSAGRAIETVKVGAEPNGVTVGTGDASGVWVGSRGDEAVWRIDPATDRGGRASARIAGGATAVETGFGSVWAVNGPGGRVVRLDPDGSDPAVSIPTGVNPSDVAVGERWVWVSNEGADNVVRIDPASNAVDEEVPVGDGPRALAAGEGGVWVANIDGQSVSRIDPDQAVTVGRPITVGQRPNDIAVGAGSVWVVDFFEGSLRRIDPEDGQVSGDPIVTEPKPRAVKVGFGSVWVANGDDDSVSRFEPSGDPIGDPVEVGDEPSDIAVGAGSVWSSDFGGATVTRVDPG